jgi:multidrug efflux pump subunit AcrA (membrane-fusion protein)
MRRRTFVFAFALVFVGVSAVILFVFKKKLNITFSDELVTVVKGDVDCRIIAEGELESDKSNPVMIPESVFEEFAINDIKIKYLAPEGKVVEKGEIIARLDDAAFQDYKEKQEKEIQELQASLDGMTEDTSSQLKDRRLALETAKLNLKIMEISVDQSSFDPPAAHEKMRLEYKKSQLAYENSLMSYKNLQTSLVAKYKSQGEKLEKLREEVKTKTPGLSGLLNISSPSGGIVTYYKLPDGSKRLRGSSVNNTDRAVAIVEDADNYVSKFYMDEEYFSRLKTGQHLKIVMKSNNVEAEATISYIHNRIEVINNRRSFMVEANIYMPKQNLLLNQTTVNIISLNSLKNVLYVPNSAVYSDNKSAFVICEDMKRANVKIERGNEKFTVIDSGLMEGQRIINNTSNPIINSDKN